MDSVGRMPMIDSDSLEKQTKGVCALLSNARLDTLQSVGCLSMPSAIRFRLISQEFDYFMTSFSVLDPYQAICLNSLIRQIFDYTAESIPSSQPVEMYNKYKLYQQNCSKENVKSVSFPPRDGLIRETEKKRRNSIKYRSINSKLV